MLRFCIFNTKHALSLVRNVLAETWSWSMVEQDVSSFCFSFQIVLQTEKSKDIFVLETFL